jgi:hypothetical protein
MEYSTTNWNDKLPEEAIVFELHSLYALLLMTDGRKRRDCHTCGKHRRFAMTAGGVEDPRSGHHVEHGDQVKNYYGRL